MSKFKTDVTYKVVNEAKGGSLETGNLYFMGVPLTYAKVLAPSKKYGSEDTAYQLNLFINADTMEKLEEIGINKEFAEVGVTKIKKGVNRGKIKYELNDTHKDFEGMFAAQFSRDTVKRGKDGEVVKKYVPLKVLDAKGRPFDQEIGNGSVCNIKTFAYRNSDGMLVVMLDTVVVVNHVPYIRESSDSFDEVLGLNIRANTVADFPLEEPNKNAKPSAKENNESVENEDDMSPF